MTTASELSTHHKPWFVRLFAISGSIPTVGLNLPFGVFIALPTLLLKRVTARPPMFRWLLAWAVAGTLAFVLSGLFHEVPLSSSSIGQFVTCALFIAAYRVSIVDSASAARLVGWLAGTMIVYYVILGPENTQGSFELLWKYGIAYPVTFVIVYMVTLRTESRFPPAVVLIALGVVGTILDYRSHGLVCFAASLLLLAKGRRGGSIFRVVVFGGAALTALIIVIPQMMSAGVFGSVVQARTLAQSDDGPLILGGRTESPLSIATILRSPFVGIGNSQAISDQDINLGVSIAQRLGMQDPSNYLPIWIREQGRISLHSVLLNSWVEGGIIAAVFPASLIVLFLWGAFASSGRFAPLVVVCGVQGVWDILFSPWAANKAVVLAATAILCALAILHNRREKSPPALPEQRAGLNGQTMLTRGA